MLSVSILSIFTLEYLPFDYMQTLEEKKKKKDFQSQMLAGYSVGWGGETAGWKEISCKEEVLLLLLKYA